MKRSKKGHKTRRNSLPTVLIIVRHAVTPLNESGMVQGARSDVSLSAAGRKQAKLLAAKLLKYRIDAIYSSDLKRCRQTIKPYAGKVGIPVHYMKELRERDYGIFDGKPDYAYNKWKEENSAKENFDLAPPKGESFRRDVMKRVSRAVRHILKQERRKTVLICGHNSINKALLLALFSQDPKGHYNDYKFSNAGITIVRVGSGKPKVVSANSTSHLVGG